MAQVVQRVWRSGPRRTKRTAWGYTLMVNGHQERKYDGAWTEDDARAALVARQEAMKALASPTPPERTLQELAQEYLAFKEEHGKRSLKEDTRILATRILPAFGSELPASSRRQPSRNTSGVASGR